ncbi:MAG TPA: SRPBCC family protein [Gammaproteobacteria bacterium]|jgi:hypothetical protein|nr:SRPBCC family protein [Gammaproteobacteria bacterium]
MRIETSMLIAAPPERIWPALANVAAWPDWLPTVTRVEPLDGAELAPGRRYRITQPRLQTAVWTVTALEAGSGFVWESRSPGMRVVGGHTIERTSGAESRLTLGIEFKGVVGAIVGRVYASLTRRYIATEAAALKTLAERDT